MTPLTALLVGVVAGAALSLPAGPAYHRVLARRGSGALYAAWRGAGPVLLRDLAPLVLALLLASLVDPPRMAAARILGLAPLLAWLLWRGWSAVELPAASQFLLPEVRSDVSWRSFVGPGLIDALWRLLLGVVLLPLGFVLVAGGVLSIGGFLLGHALAFLGMHGLLAWDQNRRSPRDRGPYVLAPGAGRLLLAGSGMSFFLAALVLVGEGAVLGFGALRG